MENEVIGSSSSKNTKKNAARYNKEARRRYNKEHYKQIVFEEKKEIVEAFREKCQKRGITQSTILRKAILEFLAEDDG